MVLGWLWGSSSPNSNLDPSLQKILKEQEAKTSNLPTLQHERTYTEKLRQSGDLSSHRAVPDASSQSQSEADSQSVSQPKVPKESLYQDGRYAHLWKNYEPQHVVESRGETEMDKLKRLQDDQDSRKVALGQAALENCVFEQLAELDCLKNGGPVAKLTLCRPQKKTFNRCYEMQCKFLKALGYWNAVGDPVRADAIQMHSDKLWGRLQEQEKEIEKAREEGKPLPHFESILSLSNVSAVGGALVQPKVVKQTPVEDQSYAYPTIPQELRSTFDTRVKDMTADEAKIEEAVFMAEMEQKRGQFVQASGYLRAEGDARRRRYESGDASIGDRIKQMTGWDKFDSQFPAPADAQARQEASVEAKR